MVRIFRNKNDKAVLINAINSISTEIGNNLDGLIKHLNNIFCDVKLICGNDIENIDKLKVNGVEVSITSDDNAIYQVFRKYIEVNGTPNVIQMKYEIKHNTVLDMKELKVISDFEDYNRIMFRDTLTGVYNRKYYDKYINNIYGNKNVAVISFDNLADINNTDGYEKGDDMLRMIAKTVSANVRKNDLIIRYNGNTFVLIVDDIDTETLKNKLNFIKEKTESFRINSCQHIKISAVISNVSGTGMNIKEHIADIIENIKSYNGSVTIV